MIDFELGISKGVLVHSGIKEGKK